MYLCCDDVVSILAVARALLVVGNPGAMAAADTILQTSLTAIGMTVTVTLLLVLLQFDNCCIDNRTR